MVTITENQLNGMLDRLEVVMGGCGTGFHYRMEDGYQCTVKARIHNGDYICIITDERFETIDVTNAEYVFKAMENKYLKLEEEKENERVSRTKDWLSQFGE